MQKNIVILGAGFGGLRCALDLSRTIPKDYRILLIDRNPYHLYYPKLFEEIVPDSQVSGVRCQVSVKEILKGTSVEFFQEEVTGVDCTTCTVEVTPSPGLRPPSPRGRGEGEGISYDYLVFALGADTDYFGIPGLKEYGSTLKSIKDAEAMRERVEEFLGSHNPSQPPVKGRGPHGTLRPFTLRGGDAPFSIMIGGAGATGVEVAAELAYLFRGVARERWSITIVEALPRILSMFPNELSQYVHTRLERLGVKLMLDTCIKSVSGAHSRDLPAGKAGIATSPTTPRNDKNGVEVVLAPRPLKPGETEAQLVCDFLPEYEKRMSVDLLLWAGGVRANSFLASCGMKVDRKGRLEVDEHLQVKEEVNMFAIGDNALLMDPTTKQPVPATAQAALLQGKIVASNIMRTINGAPLALYPFPRFPAIVPLADKDAVALIGNHVVRGFPAWLLRRAADARYFISLNYRLRGLRRFLRWLLIWWQPW